MVDQTDLIEFFETLPEVYAEFDEVWYFKVDSALGELRFGYCAQWSNVYLNFGPESSFEIALKAVVVRLWRRLPTDVPELRVECGSCRLTITKNPFAFRLDGEGKALDD